MKKPFYESTYSELKEFLLAENLHPVGADRLYSWHYKQKRQTPCREDLAHATQNFIEKNFHFDLPQIASVHQSEDGTVKFLIQLQDGLKVETVLIRFLDKYSLCLSTQVGCAMKCSFCFTGLQGLKRNLSTSEIVGQFLLAWNWLEINRPLDFKIRNLVYMGQGEPLHNFDAVKKANQIFLTRQGTCLSALRITVSTAGFIPGLLRWKEEMPEVNLALSLHSPIEEIRNQLIPINMRYPLKDVMEILDQIPLKRKQFITYEYLLIKDFNDSAEDAKATGELLKSRRGRTIINLIPFNPIPGSNFQRPEFSRVVDFQQILEKNYRLPTMIRKTKGDAILAACGQLNTKETHA